MGGNKEYKTYLSNLLKKSSWEELPLEIFIDDLVEDEDPASTRSRQRSEDGGEAFSKNGVEEKIQQIKRKLTVLFSRPEDSKKSRS